MSRFSKILPVFLVLAVLQTVFAAAASKNPESTPASEGAATLKISLTLVGVTAYADYQEIRAALVQSTGVAQTDLVAEAPGLITLEVRYEGEPQGLADKLAGFFDKKYKIEVKDLFSGRREIVLSKT